MASSPTGKCPSASAPCSSARGRRGTSFQVAFRYHVADDIKPPAKKGPLAVTIQYDRTELQVGNEVKAVARVENLTATPAPMVLLDLPIPPGFAVDPEEFATLVNKE